VCVCVCLVPLVTTSIPSTSHVPSVHLTVCLSMCLFVCLSVCPVMCVCRCVSCPAGHYINPINVTCTKCPPDSIVNSINPWGIESCVKCGRGLRPFQGRRCIPQCQYVSERNQRRYDWTSLAKLVFIGSFVYH